LSKGLASVKTLTAKQIADKWKLPLSVVAKKIAAGVKVEKEHTTSTRQANEIARDHLGERPDYYDKLDKMEKTKIVKENTTVTAGIGGLGFNTGTPAIDADNQYIDTNSMSYEDWNGAILKMIKDKHHNHLIDMGFTSYSPNDIQTASNKIVKEAKHPLQANYDKYRKGELNELGEYDNKGGMSGYEGTSGPIGNKPDLIVDRGGEKGQTKYGQQFKEETKMDNKELINEALDCILEDNLPEMKDNLMKALQEKAMEKLEERKKEIAANYFAQ